MPSTTDYLDLYLPDFEESGWDDEVNENAETIDRTLEAHAGVGVFTKLQADASAGASTVFLDPAPSMLQERGGGLLIDVGDSEFEFQAVTAANVDGNEVTLTYPLDYAHSRGDTVYFNYGNGPIYASWIGMVSDATDAAAIRNYTAFNRFASTGGQAQARVGGGWLKIDGVYYVKGICKAQGNSVLVTGNSGYSRSALLRASSGFPFDAAGNASVLAIQDDSGAYSTWANGITTADTTCTVTGLTIDANNLSDGIGFVVQPQQPGFIRDLSILNCPRIGMAFGGQNYADLENIQIATCGLGLYVSHCPWQIRNCNITNPMSYGGVSTSLKIAGRAGAMYGGYIENGSVPGPIIDIIGGADAILLSNFFSSGFFDGTTGVIVNVDAPSVNPAGKASYEITQFRCDQNGTTIKFIRDVQRQFSINNQTHVPNRILSIKAQGDAATYWGPSGWTAATTNTPQGHNA